MPASPLYRTREIARQTCIRGFTGRQIIKSGVFDASTLTPVTFTPPAQYSAIYGSSLQAVTGFVVPIGSFLTKSTGDPTKVKVYQGLGVNQNDVQTVSITGSPTGGTFTLTFNGQTTTAIPFNASAAVVAAALAALSNVGGGNVSASGGPEPGTPVVVTFIGLLGNVVQPAMTANSGGLTGGSSPTATVTHTTPGTTGESIIGVFDGPDRDYFNNTVAADEPVPIYFHSVSFDVSKLQNWQAFGEAAIVALPSCTFY